MTTHAPALDHLRCFENTWSDSTPARDVRFILLDSETTGLDPRKDRIITIGAVAVIDGEIVLEDSYDALLKVAVNTSAVTVHGTTREESLQGIEEPEALAQFLAYARDGVIVGHHIAHDMECFNVGYERHFGFRMRNVSLDTMALTLHLERDGAFAGREAINQYTLDSLCEMFGVIPHDRHTAPGDAFLTAQVFQRLLRLAARCGRTTLGQLVEDH
jgi:DNA polymerase III subunit epsilon